MVELGVFRSRNWKANNTMAKRKKAKQENKNQQQNTQKGKD
jgi:hypothetical protein